MRSPQDEHAVQQLAGALAFAEEMQVIAGLDDAEMTELVQWLASVHPEGMAVIEREHQDEEETA